MESFYHQTLKPLSESELRARRAVAAGRQLINPTPAPSQATSAEHELREYMQELGLRLASRAPRRI
ncbi:hypothetical protein BOTU111921_14385 [Bordetella tumbae]